VTTGFFTKPADRATLYYMGNTRSIVATAALAAAAAAMSACSATDTSAAPVAAPDVVISTAGQTAEATAAAARSAKPDNWVVPASAVSVPAGVLAPGAEVAVGTPAGWGSCTLGAGIRAGDRTGFATAGHCDRYGDTVRLDSASGAPLGVLSDADKSYDIVAEVLSDSAAVWTNTPAPAAATVAGLPVAGVMTRDGAMTLKSGTPVCFDGATSGLVCSPLKSALITSLVVDGVAVGGDSGAPAFVVDGDTGAVTLLGIVKMVKNMTTVTYLDPALERLGAQALVDPTSAASVAGDPRYSRNVEPLS
jgi:hypothetical protein